MRLVVPNKAVQFRDPRLNRARLKVVGSGIFKFFCDNLQPKVASDIISSTNVDYRKWRIINKIRNGNHGKIITE